MCAYKRHSFFSAQVEEDESIVNKQFAKPQTVLLRSCEAVRPVSVRVVGPIVMVIINSMQGLTSKLFFLASFIKRKGRKSPPYKPLTFQNNLVNIQLNMQAVRLYLVHDKDGGGDITLKCEVVSANQQLV